MNRMSRITGTKETKLSRTTIVTFQSSESKGEYFYINGIPMGENHLNSSTAPNLDIREFDVSSLVQNGSKRFCIPSSPFSQNASGFTMWRASCFQCVS